MEAVLQFLRKLEQANIIQRYALGGAFALLFYAEPTLTYDIDVFIFLPKHDTTGLVDLDPLYRFCEEKGYRSDKEHIVIAGVPVQFIPAYNSLVEEAVHSAKEKDYKGIQTRTLSLEHLLAIMIQTNRSKDRERIASLIDEGSFDRPRLMGILERHGLQTRWEQHFGKF